MSGREIDSPLAAEMEKDRLSPVFFFEMETTQAGEYARAWSGHGTFVWDGVPFLGVGKLGKVAALQMTTEIRATGSVFELSGLDIAAVEQSRRYLVQGLKVQFWIGAVDSAVQLVGRPYLLRRAFLDTVQITVGAETAVIRIATEGRLIDLRRPRVMRFTSQSQQRRDPTDTGFRYVPPLQDQELFWGRAS